MLEKLGCDGDGDFCRGVVADGEAKRAVDFLNKFGWYSGFAEFPGEGGAF
jgi:hypothetical protein